MLSATVPFFGWIVLTLVLWVAVRAVDAFTRRFVFRAARRLARWISTRELMVERVSKPLGHLAPYGIVLAIAALAIGLIVLGATLFIEIAGEVLVTSSELQVLDEQIHESVGEWRRESLLPFFMTMAVVGDPEGLALILVAAVAVALLRKEFYLALWGALTGGGGALLNLGLKELFSRQRPDLTAALADAPGFSFPSGHTMGSLIVLGTVVWIAVRLTKSRRNAAFAFAAGLAGTIAISASRVYLGVHWLSDIAAGLSVGLAWLATCVLLYEATRRVRTIRRDLKG